MQHSEILYQLTPSSNIADGLKQFGLSAQTKHLLVIKVCSVQVTSDQLLQHLETVVEGDVGQVSQIGSCSLLAVDQVAKVGRTVVSE